MKFPNVQAAFDEALSEALKGNETRVNLSDYTGSFLVPGSIGSPPRETAKRVVPPGVNFTPQPRISGVLRDRYLEHLREACALEYIDVTELEARISAMMIANTEDEFKFLIHDLPPLESAVKEGGKKTLKEQRSHAVEFTGYSLLTTAMYAGSVPAHSVTGQIISMILWGIASVLWITTVSKWKTYNTTKGKDTKKE